MHVTLDIPDELARALIDEGQDPSRAALEAWGLEAFRERRLSEYQLRTLLGLESRWDLHALFKERKVEMYTLEELQQDLATIREFREQHKLDRPA
jgi:cobalamin biosynthesis Mg chelatase CobN